MHLGNDWIKSETPEVAVAEAIYTHFEMVNVFLGFARSKRLIVLGGISRPDSIMLLKER
jgi:hypothetical protein